MENSLGSAIEKIKREEQNKEIKLKAKRELEAARAAVDRSIRETVTQIKKLQQDKADLIKRTDDLLAQVTIQKIRRDALLAQLSSSNKDLEEIKSKSEKATLELQELRASYCKAVQEVSDECDVWSLLTKPSTESLPRAVVKKSFEVDNNNELTLVNERLKNAKERREKALAERERLKSEPDNGEEFIRIKNALRYSLEMTANLRK
ncbi:hypothetical protein NE865_15415 [Phthorimaea operculella]|nr:hypothetical protein NE865_15415 [Phthorimaea operculella]